MEPSTIALLIMAAVIVMYFIKQIPLAVTSVVAALAMFYFGILDFKSAFSGFASSSVMLVMGMMVIGVAFEHVGLASMVSKRLLRYVNVSEKTFILLILSVTALFAGFFSSIVVMTIMLRIADRMSVTTEGRISRKQLYLPIAFGAIYGSAMTSISAASIIAGSATLSDHIGRGFTFFEPGILGLPIVLVTIVVYWLFGYKLQKRCFTFDEEPLTDMQEEAETHVPKWKQILTLVVILGCVVCLFFGVTESGAIALTGAIILIISGCVNRKTIFREINWSVILIVVGSIGFALGIKNSGAGTVIANTIVTVFGAMANNAFFMCIVFLVLSVILTAFTSNTSTIAVVLPIALSVADSLGANLLPFGLAVCVGANLSTSTPIACANISLTTVVGYRTKDYLKVGGLFTVIATVVAALLLRVVYF